MRRYRIREKLISWGDDFTIQDEHGRDVFLVDGKAFTMRDRLKLKGLDGRELADIHRKVLSLGPAYVIERDGRKTEIRKHLFTLLRAKFTVDVPGPNDLEAQGDLLGHEYAFRDASGREVARVSRKLFSLADTYGVEVSDGADDVTILCAAIVIDRMLHED